MGIATLPTIEEIRNRWAERGQLADGAWHPRHTRPDDGRTDLVADMCARDVAVLLAELARLRAGVSRCITGMEDPRDFAEKEAWAEELHTLIAGT